MQNFKSFLFVVLTVIVTGSSEVRKDTREFLQTPEDQNDYRKLGGKGVLPWNVLSNDMVDGVLSNGGEFRSDMKNDPEIIQALTASGVQDARNAELGTPKLKCYGSTTKWPLPYEVISCTGSCYLRKHWSRLGNYISRGCSPEHRQTRTIYAPIFVKYCNTNFCNLR